MNDDLHLREAVMNRIVVAAITIALLPAAAPGQSPDELDVRAVINQYFHGHATGDPAEMRKAFWPTAHIEGIRQGKFVSWTADEYCSRFNGKPAADEASRKRTIDRVEVSGSAAMAGATLVHGRTTFTDYFVLLKEGNTWKIANKVYSSRQTN
jgi:Putative lumazine-binding